MGSLGSDTREYRRQQGPFEIFERLLGLIGPCKRRILLSHPGQRFCNFRKVSHEFPVVAGEAVESADITKAVWCRPIANGCKLVWLWLDPISRDHVSEEVDWATEENTLRRFGF